MSGPHVEATIEGLRSQIEHLEQQRDRAERENRARTVDMGDAALRASVVNFLRAEGWRVVKLKWREGVRPLLVIEEELGE